MSDARKADVAIVGAGPAGLAAAIAAQRAGRHAIVLDQGINAGGQIWRHRDRALLPAAAQTLLAQFEASGAEFVSGAQVVDARAGHVLVVQNGTAMRVNASRIILATGARELLLPFPGWTLPNVFGVGGLQALIKSGLDVGGKRIAIAGSGPLPLPVAAAAAKAGAELVCVAEQASLRRVLTFGAALLASPAPGKLLDAARYRRAFASVRYHTGTWIVRATGADRVDAVTLSNGRRTWTVACDYVAAAAGLVPNAELGALLGCAHTDAIQVNDRQETSVPGVFAAGECAGVAGEDVALLEGTIAGLVAAGQQPASSLLSRRARLRRLAEGMQRAFAPRRELIQRCEPDTIVCRCEDVYCRELSPDLESRQARLLTRVGMGACQGRTCGAAMHVLRGWELPSVRAPLSPVPAQAYSALETDS